jgi:hypothetical protein
MIIVSEFTTNTRLNAFVYGIALLTIMWSLIWDEEALLAQIWQLELGRSEHILQPLYADSSISHCGKQLFSQSSILLMHMRFCIFWVFCASLPNQVEHTVLKSQLHICNYE